jgi:phosphoribosylamine--glycine ligase
VVVFHGATARTAKGDVVTSGGRVLCITAMGKDLEEARARAYEAYDKLHWQGKFCRRDIGVRDQARKTREPAPPTGEGERNPRPARTGPHRPRRAAP